MEAVEGVVDDDQYFADVERDHLEEESDVAEPEGDLPTDDQDQGDEAEEEEEVENEDQAAFESDSSSIVDELLFVDEDNEVLGGLQVPHTPDEGDLVVGSRRVSMVEGIEELPEEILLVVKRYVFSRFARLYFTHRWQAVLGYILVDPLH